MRGVLVAFVLLGAAAPLAADPLENAYFVCDIFERTGVSSECQASNATATVSVIVDTTPADAANICTVISRQMAEKRRFFGGRWQLRVFAPDQANEPLAACPLP